MLKDANESVFKAKPFGFLSKQHIRKATEFNLVIQRGKRLSLSCLAFYFLKNDRDYPRLGMIVNKRNCPLAVNRNRIKRVIREHFRFIQKDIIGFDLVVMLKSPAQKISDQELQSCLEKLFLQLNTLCNGLS